MSQSSNPSPCFSNEKKPQYNYQNAATTPPPGYPQGPQYISQQPNSVVLSTKPGFKSQLLFCPSCQTNVTSDTEFENGAFAWGSAFCCCILGCWLGCCCIPLVVDNCKDVTHSCPNCRAQLAQRSRL
ncbi:hypothetical protein SARC_12136 [Sphaeroforma arctica JP610]|uniref:LITAF domain-containing protein n=1 Tax=Sphaeroforma arctica JP610 TaxID=667725 RepID=A0A0L0FEX8_9EUKA|nr:hypothetical protein SARC_12136 [Sphaeroforma arctica JP610]KNC75334.1 hypothetical protein SARC_12136 [Sphaeroforma arctica JP610]|eukprot:XP_014149236.1 hypothetical protein SARC_12136 [Sphaeroforma arctica JP610]